MNKCQKLLLLILATIWNNVLQIQALDCYICSSLEDYTCGLNPKTVATCPNVSTACSKIIMKEIKYQYIFNNTEFNTAQNEVVWNGENLDWIVIGKPIYVIIRKCYNEKLHRTKRTGCYRYLDAYQEATVCTCADDLCNDAAGLQLNLKALTMWYSLLQSIF